MRNRHTTLLWMKDLIEHMNRCHEQLQWAADGPTETFPDRVADGRPDRMPPPLRAAPVAPAKAAGIASA